MPLPASRARTVFRACVVHAIREGEALMEQLVASTRAALTGQESSSREVQQRQQLAEALRLLAQHEAALVKGYPMALLETFAEGPGQPRARGAAADTGIDFGELSLMDDAEVLAQVELSRAQQVAVHATEAALAELNGLVSSAQGLPSVQPERNPLRPENYIRALQQVVGDTGVPGDIRQLWMAPMRDLLGTQLVGVYQRAAQSLREQGVEPVGYAVAGVPGAARTAAGGFAGSAQMGVGAGGHGYGYGYAPSAQAGLAGPYGGSASMPLHAPVSGWAGAASAAMPLAPAAEEALLTVGMLRQMLAGAGDPFALDAPRAAAAPALAPGAVAVPGPAAHGSYLPQDAADALQDLAQLERLVGRLAAGQGAGAPVAPAAATGWGGTTASHGLAPATAESAAQDVVSRMMNNIAQDARLLPPMQRAVQSLAPALKELVRHDTRFFTDEQHPARRLLDELTQRSLAFDREDSPSFSRFMRLVNEVVGHLATARIESAAPFERVLRALEKAWEAQERHRRERREAKQRELLLREQREMLAERLAADFRRLDEARGAPQDLLAFVTGPWAEVVALARTAAGPEGGDDPDGYQALAPLLLACGQDDILRAEPEALAQALDEALPRVRQGLERLGHAPERTEALLQRLAGLQQQAQDLAAARALAPAPGPQPEPQPAPESREAPAGAGPESALPESAQAPLEPAAPAALPAADTSADTDAGADADAALDGPAQRQAPAQDVAPAEPPALAAQAGDPGESPSVAGALQAAPAGQPREPLQLGQWFEIGSQQGVVRTQLTWASPHNTLFLFTGADGSTQSMTRRMIDKLAAEGSFRQAAAQPVVDQALSRAARPRAATAGRGR